MTGKFKKAISMAMAFIMTLTLMTLLPNTLTSLAADTTRVYGRVIPANRTGDTSDWVEIAQNGGYSLILRKDVLPLGWVNFPKSGTNNNYMASNARDVVNNWFGNTLATSARLRDYTMTNDITTQLGIFAITTNGISKPGTTQVRTGTDIAFLLSFGEAAQFCSMQYATSKTTWTQSSSEARSNFAQLTPLPTSPPQRDFWWLRSPGYAATNVSSVGTHNSAMANTVWCSSALSSSGASYVYIRPALWVASGIFDAVTRTLTYNANGGTGAPPAQSGIPTGTNTTISYTTPQNGSRQFLGWATISNATAPIYQPGASIRMDTDVTLYAVWGPDPGTLVTLTYNANGGNANSIPPQQTNIPIGTVATISMTRPTHTNSSLTFAGWATSPSATLPQYQPGGSIIMSTNITLYAVWSTSVITPNIPEGVVGKTLPPSKSGDSVDWIEIARYGEYSLIYRTRYLNIMTASYAVRDVPEQQYIPYGSTATPPDYNPSFVRNFTNDWFNNSQSPAPNNADRLPSNARLRDYTMQNSALTVKGTASTAAALNNGFSLPSNTQLRTGNDVAFALSYGESANFVSKTHYIRLGNPDTRASNSIAIDNFARITLPPDNGTIRYGAWLRSSGDNNTTMGALENNGRAFQYNTSGDEHGLVQPALWVRSTIFDEVTAPLRTLSYSANGGTGAPPQQTGIPDGTYATISTVIPQNGNRGFQGWATTSNATVPQYQPGGTILMNGDYTLHAVWGPQVTFVTLSYNANGGIGAPPAQTNIPINTLAQISATEPTRAGDVFIGWDINQAGVTPMYFPGGNILMTGNITLVAVWETWSTLGNIKNAYINASATPQNGTQAIPEPVGRNDTVSYEIKFDKWIPDPLPTLPNPTFQTKLQMPGKLNFSNGSFELPYVNNSSGNLILAQSQVPGWNTRPVNSSDSGNPLAYMIEIQQANPGGVNQAQFAQNTPDGGRQYAELNAHVEGTLYQICDTVPGTKIYYEFWHGARMSNAAPSVNRDVLSFYIRPEGSSSTAGGKQSTATATRGAAYTWTQNVGTYTVPAGQTRTEFAFQSVSTTSGYHSVGNFLDGVRLYTNSYVDLTKTNNAPNGKADVGDTVTYTIIAQNKGESDASNVKIIDTLPIGTAFVPGSVKIDGVNAPTGNYSYVSGTRQLTINIGAGASSSAGGRIKGDGSFSTDCNNSYTITFQVTVTNTAIAQNQKYENQASVTYQDRYDTTSPTTYANYSNVNEFALERRNASATITDAIPVGMDIISHSEPNGAVFSYNATTRVCTWTWTQFPTTNVSVTVTVTVNPATQQANFNNQATLTIGGNTRNTNFTYHRFSDARTVTGLIWPMAIDDLGVQGFLQLHEVTVELRTTFLTPAPASLSTKAVMEGFDGTGRFTFQNVPVGEYILYIYRAGFVTRALAVSITPASPSVITLAPPAYGGENGVFRLWWGDCNNDLSVDAMDAMRIISLLPMQVDAFSQYYSPGCDMNADGVIDGKDLMLVYERWNRCILDYAGSEDIDVFS